MISSRSKIKDLVSDGTRTKKLKKKLNQTFQLTYSSYPKGLGEERCLSLGGRTEFSQWMKKCYRWKYAPDRMSHQVFRNKKPKRERERDLYFRWWEGGHQAYGKIIFLGSSKNRRKSLSGDQDAISVCEEGMGVRYPRFLPGPCVSCQLTTHDGQDADIEWHGSLKK